MKAFFIIGIIVFYFKFYLNYVFVLKLMNFSKLTKIQKRNVIGALISTLIGFAISFIIINYVCDVFYEFYDSLELEE